jgi:hypothetical protein
MLLTGLMEVVTTTVDLPSIGGTLQDAINRIDSNPDMSSLNSIDFQIPTTDPGYNPANGTFTFSLQSVLPPITNPAFVDGTTEATFLGQPALVVIDGQGIKAPADGLDLEGHADGSTIYGLKIVNFSGLGGSGGNGIAIETANNTIGGLASNQGNILGSNTGDGISIPVFVNALGPENNNLIIGNFIGTDASGANLGNGFGLEIATPNNTVGGTASGAANVIGFNTGGGVGISGSLGNQNVVLGNFIGTNAAGANLANPVGVFVQSQGNTIGGTTSAAANVIGFNTSEGILISSSLALNNVVLGNLIGTNAAGANLANLVGISLDVGSNTIGGAAAGMGNVIGFNGTGLEIDAPNNVVIGNLFGTDASGANLGNVYGVLDFAGSNTIGGTSAGTANVFGFNFNAGVALSAAGAGARADVVLGNFFGTNASGANLGNSVGVLDSAGSNTIGGTSAGASNIFGSNTTAGLQIAGSASNEAVLGNFFGTNASGANLGNAVGVMIISGANTVGGTAVGSANVFGFNSSSGLEIFDSDTTGNVVLGNFFGTNASGADLGNSIGITINGSPGNTVGGTATGAANVIGFSVSEGIDIEGLFARDNLVIGNLIGSNANGADLGNSIGITINGSSGNTVGGTATGAGNVIGFSVSEGIDIEGLFARDNLVIGNLIGSNANGADVGNVVGVLDSVGSNTIGGTSAGAANVFGFNSTAGLEIAGTNDLVVGNSFGTSSGGANVGNAVGLLLQSANNTIGGTSSGTANVFGFNSTAGLQVTGPGATNEAVIGNFFGTDAGDRSLGNTVGLLLQTGNNTIGGTSAGTANVFGFNSTAGIQITGADATNEVVVGNRFGVDATIGDIGNVVGLRIETASNTIGGTSAGAANVIGFNSTAGIQITGSGATANVVLGTFFGTDANGDNLANSIGLDVGGAANTIGGTTPSAANVFGFSSTAGALVDGTNDLLIGNLFGVDGSGTSVHNVGNVVGVLLESGPNTVGGTAAGTANIFGFNTRGGFEIQGTSATKNVVEGNLFGTNPSGANLGNVVGLSVGGGSNTIGGTAVGAGNTFAFNSTAGVKIAGDSATRNVLIGNLIGTNASGANWSNAVGVDVESGGNTIGGTAPGSANVISQNSTAGVQITGTGASGNVLLGNLIGTDASGRVAQGNDIGVLVSGGTANVIGAPGAGNVISGNFTAGIELTGSSVTGTQIVGNRIGTDQSGTSAVARPNEPDLSALQNAGIAIIDSVGNTVGGTGQAANQISGNYVGVNIANIAAGVGENLVVGNLIGTNASGTAPLGNIVGIYINSAAGNQIGAPGMANTISGNSSVGVEIYGSGSTGNLVEANIIGLAKDGQSAFQQNGRFVQPTGVFIYNASSNLIGGPTTAAGNVISGNESAGVYIFSRFGISSGNTVRGNLIGLAKGGGRGPGNNGYGVLLLNAPNNQAPLKGPATNRFGRNRIANFRKLSRPAAANQFLTAKSRAQDAASKSGSHHRPLHPAGPLIHRLRRV